MRKFEACHHICRTGHFRHRLLELAVGAIYTRDQLIIQRKQWRSAGRKVVFTNGCYDILHPGHMRLLESARSLGRPDIIEIESQWDCEPGGCSNRL